MPTVSLRLREYKIVKEDDGWLGDGVDLYTGLIVNTPTQAFGRCSPCHGGLKKGNRSIGDQLVDLAIPLGKLGLIDLHLYESDSTSEEVEECFKKATVPKLSDYAVHIEDIRTESESRINEQGEREWTFTVYIDIEGSLNTDDDYGRWAVRAAAFTDKAYVAARPRGNSCKVNAPLVATLDYDAKFREVARLVFRDGENDIEMVLDGRAHFALESSVFDAAYYIQHNSDLFWPRLSMLAKAMAPSRWVDDGVKQGRQAHPKFHLTEYAALYPDVRAACGDDPWRIIRHYVTIGLPEGRSGVRPG
jgi:hypothetical protein